jgi:hypothetical protein
LTSTVRVTHPFHPQCGEAIDVVAQRVQWGEARVFYRDPQGLRSSLPARWTSLTPVDPYLAVGAGRSRFRVQDLIDLAALLAELR